MGTEIERKFLVDTSLLPVMEPGIKITQGYLSEHPGVTTRIRKSEFINGHHRCYITIKGPTEGITRKEFEYPVPMSDGEEMLEMCGATLEKTRFRIDKWEIDQFDGNNKGLVVAEIELESEDEYFERPDWLGEEVSDDVRYYNNNLMNNPVNNWTKDGKLLA